MMKYMQYTKISETFYICFIKVSCLDNYVLILKRFVEDYDVPIKFC